MRIYSIKVTSKRFYTKSDVDYLVGRCKFLSSNIKKLSGVKYCFFWYCEEDENFRFYIKDIKERKTEILISKQKEVINNGFSIQNYDNWPALKKAVLLFVKQSLIEGA